MIQECDVLNRVLSLVMQASAALKNVTTADNGMKTKLLNFEIKDKFAPAQKNEVQVPLKKTSKEPGRKKKSKQLSAPNVDDKEDTWSRIENGISIDDKRDNMVL